MTALSPRVIGVDGSVAAVERARLETKDGEVEFRVADASDPAFGQRMSAELGDVNVHVRGMLHVVDPKARPVVVANLAALLGRRGTA